MHANLNAELQLIGLLRVMYDPRITLQQQISEQLKAHRLHILPGEIPAIVSGPTALVRVTQEWFLNHAAASTRVGCQLHRVISPRSPPGEDGHCLNRSVSSTHVVDLLFRLLEHHFGETPWCVPGEVPNLDGHFIQSSSSESQHG
ncbi:MAG: hypothetical protein JF606_08165 [Burkholderiales bacterium]|nr:hypothetical protein [Burkholderiales bacterium]